MRTPNLRNTWISLVAGVITASTTAMANPYYTPENSNWARLTIEAQELQREVEMTNIHFSIKDLVARFVYRAETFAACSRGPHYPAYSDSNVPRYPGYPGNPNRPPERRCELEKDRMIDSFSQFESYLSNTYYNFPRVFGQFQRTQELVNFFRMNNDSGNYPWPGQQEIRATGLLDTVHFQFVGRDRFDIERQCLNFGGSYGMRGVRGVVVNGRRFNSGNHAPMSLNQACQIVAEYSR